MFVSWELKVFHWERKQQIHTDLFGARKLTNLQFLGGLDSFLSHCIFFFPETQVLNGSCFCSGFEKYPTISQFADAEGELLSVLDFQGTVPVPGIAFWATTAILKALRSDIPGRCVRSHPGTESSLPSRAPSPQDRNNQCPLSRGDPRKYIAVRLCVMCKRV